MNTAEMHNWVVSHPKFNKVGEAGGITVELTPMMVDPEDDHVKINQTRNTKLVWWVETLIYQWDGSIGEYISVHDWDLDCGGDTAEEAVSALYELVKGKYGGYDETK